MQSGIFQVRNLDSDAARDLAANGVTLFRGNLFDPASIRAAMAGAHGVFSVQPNSGSANSDITNDEEVRFGKSVVNLAVDSGVQHLVYSSASILGKGPTGLENLDCKLEIEDHVRRSDIASTIIRPSTFMELLTLSGMGLDKGTISFFLHLEQPVELIASQDIGKIVAAVLGNTERYSGQTISIAGDELTGIEIQSAMTGAAGQPITYRRFPDALLEKNTFLRRNAELFDGGRAAGNTDIPALSKEFGKLFNLKDWLKGPGMPRLLSALQASQNEVALQ
ncbi:NmrA family NAD(P)-binding protein [Paracoccus onubensis]|uniref:NmrA/HSCARG family protein n=1 Tax=Paracoccus onubensis TaxID=1675788 RepID=A0A418SM57_9RHOB|nr:NmrA family NAD(P)-binding protein [Paracoccus onubensis]RJE82021.1 NmrA/HSCARG family protein [Paracoccus onubensis]